MSDSFVKQQDTPVRPDVGWFAQAAGIHAIVAGYAVAQVLPVLVASLTHALKLSIDQASWLAFADLGTATVGTLLGALCIRRWRLASILRWGAVLTIAGNLACLSASGFGPLFILRLISGFGEGVMVATGTAVLARTRLPQRAFAMAAAGQAGAGALGVAVFPAITAHWGWQAFFVVVAIFAAPALIVARSFPESESQGPSQARGRFSAAAWIAILAMTITYVGLGGIWANLGRLGERAMLGLPAISYGISAATAIAPGATILAAIVGDRIPTWICLAFATVALAAGAALLDLSSSGLWFAVGAMAFMFGWSLFAPYASAVASVVDRTGAAAIVATSCAGGGLAIGPVLAIPLVNRFGFGAIPPLTIVLVITAFCLLAPIAKPKAASAVLQRALADPLSDVVS